MKAIILAAGYGTRLYPLTKAVPKALLSVAGRSILDWLLCNLAGISVLDRIYIVTNDRFAENFSRWQKSGGEKKTTTPVEVLSDGSTSENNKLGAVGDLHFVIRERKIKDDLLVVAGDNLIGESFRDFTLFGRSENTPVLATWDFSEETDLSRYNAIETKSNGVLSYFKEKPQGKFGKTIGIALYYYPAKVLPLVEEYLKGGNNPDQPGRLIEWLYTRLSVRTYKIKGMWYDIGSREVLERANGYLNL